MGLSYRLMKFVLGSNIWREIWCFKMIKCIEKLQRRCSWCDLVVSIYGMFSGHVKVWGMCDGRTVSDLSANLTVMKNFKTKWGMGKISILIWNVQWTRHCLGDVWCENWILSICEFWQLERIFWINKTRKRSAFCLVWYKWLGRKLIPICGKTEPFSQITSDFRSPSGGCTILLLNCGIDFDFVYLNILNYSLFFFYFSFFVQSVLRWTSRVLLYHRCVESVLNSLRW